VQQVKAHDPMSWTRAPGTCAHDEPMARRCHGFDPWLRCAEPGGCGEIACLSMSNMAHNSRPHMIQLSRNRDQLSGGRRTEMHHVHRYGHWSRRRNRTSAFHGQRGQNRDSGAPQLRTAVGQRVAGFGFRALAAVWIPARPQRAPHGRGSGGRLRSRAYFTWRGPLRLHLDRRQPPDRGHEEPAEI